MDRYQRTLRAESANRTHLFRGIRAFSGSCVFDFRIKDDPRNTRTNTKCAVNYHLMKTKIIDAFGPRLLQLEPLAHFKRLALTGGVFVLCAHENSLSAD
jgi:hypothetical protein